MQLATYPIRIINNNGIIDSVSMSMTKLFGLSNIVRSSRWLIEWYFLKFKHNFFWKAYSLFVVDIFSRINYVCVRNCHSIFIQDLRSLAGAKKAMQSIATYLYENFPCNLHTVFMRFFCCYDATGYDSIGRSIYHYPSRTRLRHPNDRYIDPKRTFYHYIK